MVFFYVLHMMAFYGAYLCAPSTDNFVDYVAEYDRMAESYSVINQKLQHSISEQANLEKTIQELKVYIIYVLNIKKSICCIATSVDDGSYLLFSRRM